jgi:hypothetical protein
VMMDTKRVENRKPPRSLGNDEQESMMMDSKRDENRKPPRSLGNEEQESVMMDSKRAMRECNLAWGYNYHQLGFTGVLEPSQDDSEEV